MTLSQHPPYVFDNRKLGDCYSKERFKRPMITPTLNFSSDLDRGLVSLSVRLSWASKPKQRELMNGCLEMEGLLNRAPERKNFLPFLFLERVRRIDELVREGFPLSDIRNRLIHLINHVSKKLKEPRHPGTVAAGVDENAVSQFGAVGGRL